MLKNNKFVIILLFAFFILVFIPLASANTTDEINVDTNNQLDLKDTSNVDDNTITDNEKNLKTDTNNALYVSEDGEGNGKTRNNPTNLDDALKTIDNNGNIYLLQNNTTEKYEFFKHINSTTVKNSTKSINIVGMAQDNVKIDCDGTSFMIEYMNVTFKNINFVDGYNFYYLGSILCVHSNVSFINCTFTNFTGNKKYGCLIYLSSSNLTVDKCKFVNSSFTNSSNFIGNSASGFFGRFMNKMPVAYTGYEHVSIKNSIFKDNNIDGDSNLIYLDACDETIIRNNTFEKNNASNSLLCLYNNEKDVVEFNIFRNNNGTPLYLMYGDGNVNRNIFQNNHALMAGAILTTYGAYNFTNNQLLNNKADYYGGAIINLGLFSQNMTNCVFINNTASYGGAIYNMYDELNIENSKFINNTADIGGALYYLRNETLDAFAEGFKDFHNQSKNTITNTLFESNKAKEANILYVLDNPIIFNNNAIYNTNKTENLIRINGHTSINLNSNWWGYNNPNFGQITGGFIPDNWIIMNITNTTTSKNPTDLKITLNTLNTQKTITGNIPARNVTFEATKGNFTKNTTVINKISLNRYTGNSQVYAIIDNQKLALNNKIESWINAENIQTHAGKNITIKIETNNDLKNNISIYIDNKLIKNMKIINKTSINYFINSNYKEGNHTINIYYPGDSKYLSNNQSIKLEVINSVKYNITNTITPLEIINKTYTTNLPRKYDPRINNQTTPLTDQKGSGSCWAFAAINTLQEAIKRQENKTTDFSENNPKNVLARFSIIGDSDKIPNDGGSGIEIISYMTGWYGPLYEYEDEYDENSVISPIKNASYHIQDVIIIPPRKTLTDIQKIKEAIYNYGAVQVVYSSSMAESIYYAKNYEDDHAATFVGWDDNYDKNNFESTVNDTTVHPKHNGAFIIKNSWGAGYADDGYQYISYDDLTYGGYQDTDGYNIAIYTFLLNNTPQYDNIYQYDEIATQKLSFNNKARIKNTYTSIDNQTLVAIGTYIIDKSNYTLKVYINNQLKHTQKGNITQIGYRTITLNKYYNLNKNDEFTIELEIQSQENNQTSIYYQYTPTHNSQYMPNRSYMSYDGKTWTDAYTSLNKGAFTLKAYTLKTPTIQTNTTYTNNTLKITTKINNNNDKATIKYILDGKTIKTQKIDENNKIITTQLDITNIKDNTLKIQYTSQKYKIEEQNNITTQKKNTKIQVTKATGIIGNTLNLKAQITDQNNNKVQEGYVIFKLNGITIKDNKKLTGSTQNLKVNIINGTATVNITADLDMRHAKNLTAVYSGSTNYNASRSNTATAEIALRNATITVTTSTKTAKQGQTITIKATIKDKNGKNNIINYNGQYVFFKINGLTLKDKNGKTLQVPIINQTATTTYTIPLALGAVTDCKTMTIRNHTITAGFVNPNYYPTARANTTIHIERSNITINYENVTINKKIHKMTLKANIKDYLGNYVKGPNKYIIKVNGQTIKNKTNQFFMAQDGKITLTNITIPQFDTYTRIEIVTQDRKAYKNQRNTTTKINVIK